ncbi:MAG: hypothetical protein AB1716_08730 [Planctomycetota bacterium]
MRHWRKLLLRVVLASILLALPRVALASDDISPNAGESLGNVFSRLSESVANALFAMVGLSGCSEANTFLFGESASE